MLARGKDSIYVSERVASKLQCWGASPCKGPADASGVFGRVSCWADGPFVMTRSSYATMINRKHLFGWLCRRRRDDAAHLPKLGLINVGRFHRHRQRAGLDAEVASHASL